ncbi:hypothetical protein SETIT_9G464800v2 [Setaria italica]|uniref:PGG domain-containing protein n=1 Tax=Setaria italica TaxID=4555 RepID=A0A368ST06_SETIT|nr:hypothetical protein SETIT_9G464800v2 [Setaria italica]
MDASVFPPLPPGGQPVSVQQLGGGRAPNSWVGNDANTLLVVATLITTLTYQLGTNIPGGYWQDSQWSKDDKLLLHRAGDPIMRDLHRHRYWVFMAARAGWDSRARW